MTARRIDVEREMQRLTVAIVLQGLLSVDLEEQTDEITRAANTLIEMIHCRTLPIVDDLLDKIALGRIRQFNNARAHFDAIVYRMVRERRVGEVNQISGAACDAAVRLSVSCHSRSVRLFLCDSALNYSG